ncbi:MAG: cell division protein FtsZ [Acidobacteriota bacterium]|nr:cell division protein FtsZ [Acidobacteriota bacterium]
MSRNSIGNNADNSPLKYELQEETRKGARIKVFGVGGGGCNAVARMVEEGLDGVEFHVMNTDEQALAASRVPSKIQIGAKITNGLGCGSDPNIGRQAALEDTERILELLHGADMVFVTAGLGGGTGAGAAPVIASLAKELDALTVAVVTKPFGFEGAKRMKAANRSLDDLASTVDTLITIPNDRLLAIAPRGTSITQAFRLADDILRQAVQGISDIIITPGLINLDFSDIKATMLGMGHAMMGTAIAKGENAAAEAARQAISCPLLEDTKILGSRRILINITGSSSLGLHEVNEACSIIREAAECDELQISFGVIANDAMGDSVKITVIATGFHGHSVPLEVLTVRSAAPAAPEWFPVPEQVAAPEPVLEMPPIERFEPPPEPAVPASVLFDDDLDTPAYLRQGKLLN